MAPAAIDFVSGMALVYAMHEDSAFNGSHLPVSSSFGLRNWPLKTMPTLDVRFGNMVAGVPVGVLVHGVFIVGVCTLGSGFDALTVETEVVVVVCSPYPSIGTL